MAKHKTKVESDGKRGTKMSLSTYKEIAESIRQSIRELGTPNSKGTHDNPELVKESIWSHRIILKACERQIGKKPIPMESGFFSCSVCKAPLIDNYCHTCGQKVDWGND